MKLNKKAVLAILLVTALLALAYYSLRISEKEKNFGLFTVPIFLTPSENTIPEAVTQMAEAQVPIPTIEIEYLYQRDLASLQEYLDENAKNWLNMSFNVHSLETSGVASSAQKVEGVACSNNTTLDDFLCRYALIEYTSVYKGVTTAGVNSDFILKPTVTLKEDWSETNRTISDSKITIVMGSTAVITYTGYSCVTSTEENSPVVIPEGQTPPTDRSYTVKTLDERRLWPDLGPFIFPTGINEELLRIDSERKAKSVALSPEKIALLLDYVLSDMSPGGPFVTEISNFYNQETAQVFGVKGFEIVINLIRGDLNTRCDGTPVLK